MLTAFAIGVLVSKAQDFKNVNNAFLLRQYDLAKGEIDKLESNPKAQAKPEFWLWKSKIYATIYKDEALRAKYPGADQVADQAYTKYFQLDPSMKLVDEMGGKDVAFDLYSTSFNQGIRTYNAKKWDSASYFFGRAVDFSNIIFKNKWSSNPTTLFDTTSVLYAGVAAQNAKKSDDAAKYYSILADNKVIGTDYKDIYTYLLVYYANKKEETPFRKYLAIGKELYPKEDWEDYEVDFMNKAYTLQQKADLYAKEDAAGGLSARKYLLFGDLFANIPKEEKASLDSLKLAEYQRKAADAFKKAFNKDNSLSIAAFNVGVIYYNEFVELDDQIVANKRTLQQMNINKPVEKDPKKKAAADAKFKSETDAIKKANADLEKPVAETMDEAITWLEKCYNTLKDKPSRDNTEKNCLNRSIDWLANLYAYKRDKVKGKDPKAFDTYDAKYKEYDALHGKY